MRLEVVYKGQKYELPKAGIKDFVFLERQFGVSAQAITDSPRMEYMVFLAYRGLRKLNAVTEPYSDQFLEDLDELDGIEEEGDAEADPTGEQAQPTG